MHFIYALISCHRQFIYVGMTNNLAERTRRHNAGYEKATKPYRPLILLYFEILDNQPEARKREIFLKNRSGKLFLYTIAYRKISFLSSCGPV
ncbi:MAG: GIY-YIG nuclease family protein [Saprospiraceae bacterium]|nr:GIY-YIG nuclease family protein [Saprospiraceae bacterium]